MVQPGKWYMVDGTCRTFSVERDSTGKRSFLVSTHEGFWKRYQDMLPDHRHYYEIIQESCPCHLYFGKSLSPKICNHTYQFMLHSRSGCV